jgi:hypothetical protein
MRHLFLLLTLFLISSLCDLIGQDSYQPINFNNGRWVFVSNQKGPFWGTYYEQDTLIYYFEGDTIIGGSLYKKLYYSGNSYCSIGNKIVAGYAGAFRDDTINRTVWYYEIPMFDYNLTINDTIERGLYSGEIIDKIDSVSYCGKYFKRFIFKNTANEPSLIENIRALDCVQMVYEGPTGYCELACYYETNNSDCSSCDIKLSDVININIQNNIIYPNPTNGKINIKHLEGLKSISIFNLSGYQMSKITDISNLNTIDISNFCPGIYIINIIAKENIYFEKIIKN